MTSCSFKVNSLETKGWWAVPKVNQQLYSRKEILPNIDGETREWLQVNSWPPEAFDDPLEMPRGGFELLTLQRLTPEYMGERRKLNDDERVYGRMVARSFALLGPETTTALHALLGKLLERPDIVEETEK